jgi:hypothetical protein
MEKIILDFLVFNWDWITFIKSILITFIIIEFPLFKEIKKRLQKVFKEKNIFYFIEKFFTCYKCNGLYIGLLVSGNLWIALAASFILMIYDKNWNSIRL